MGKEKIKLPSTPAGWAIHLSKIVKIFHEVHGLDRFPIKVADIARDYTRNVYADEPITRVDGERFGKKFEGALIPRPGASREWGIFYNSSISSPGRINFTLAHELGHYLLHRQLSREGIYCARRDMWTWDSAYGQMEAEANQFASFLLMPLDDFRLRTDGLRKPNIRDFEGLRERYGVSLTAAILKWLETTSSRAMIVVSRDGFIDWSWSSKPLLKSGVYFKAKQTVTPLPDGSLAAKQDTSEDAMSGKLLPKGVWSLREDVLESVIYSEYHDMAISLLIYPNDPPLWEGREGFVRDEIELVDTFDRMRTR
jgi:hypothetical protein